MFFSFQRFQRKEHHLKFSKDVNQDKTHSASSSLDCAFASSVNSVNPANRSFNLICIILSFAISTLIFFLTSPSTSAFLINWEVTSVISSKVASSAIPSSLCKLALSILRFLASLFCAFLTFHGRELSGFGMDSPADFFLALRVVDDIIVNWLLELRTVICDL